jgi:hypothetical protein
MGCREEINLLCYTGVSMEKTKKTEYVNNKDFLAAMVLFRQSVKEARNNNTERPIVPTYIGECIMKIGTHLSQKPNFVNYTFRDEMISDGIENCLQYIDNFDPEKSQNPFAYFTQIIYYAFLRRIQKEKKVLYVKYKLTEENNTLLMNSELQDHDHGRFANSDENRFGEWNSSYIEDFISTFEETKRRKIRKKDKIGDEIDDVFEDLEHELIDENSPSN